MNVLYRIQSALLLLLQPRRPMTHSYVTKWCLLGGGTTTLKEWRRERGPSWLRPHTSQCETYTTLPDMLKPVQAGREHEPMFTWFGQKKKQKKNNEDGGYPASLLVTKEDFLWGRSWGVGMWSPVTRFLSWPATGSCLFFILALAML